jgi:hypothetical protein
MSSTPAGNTTAAPSLKRSLGLWDLVMYGIIVIQPTAPMPGYGVFANASQGQVVTCIPYRHGRHGFTATAADAWRALSQRGLAPRMSARDTPCAGLRHRLSMVMIT